MSASSIPHRDCLKILRGRIERTVPTIAVLVPSLSSTQLAYESHVQAYYASLACNGSSLLSLSAALNDTDMPSCTILLILTYFFTILVYHTFCL